VPKTTYNPNALVARAVLKETRTTPQKARRVVNIIRGVRADSALTTLKFANQEIAGELYTLLASAVANAKQKNPALRGADELWVAEALVDEGLTMKRFRPRAQGRGFQILKRTSTITLTVSDDRNYRSNTPKQILRSAAKSVLTDVKTDSDVSEKVVAKKAEAKKAPAKKAPAKKAEAKKAEAKKAPAKKAPAKQEGKAE
jgi:large subunit ribosomal protein L22